MYRESYYYYFTAQHKCEKLMIEVQAEDIPIHTINGQSNNNVNGINKHDSEIANLEFSG